MPENLDFLGEVPASVETANTEAAASGQATAKKAVQLLAARGEGYSEPSAIARRHICMAFPRPSLTDLFKKARRIYPSWSISF